MTSHFKAFNKKKTTTNGVEKSDLGLEQDTKICLGLTAYLQILYCMIRNVVIGTIDKSIEINVREN
jgi:hypothetical protein